VDRRTGIDLTPVIPCGAVNGAGQTSLVHRPSLDAEEIYRLIKMSFDWTFSFMEASHALRRKEDLGWLPPHGLSSGFSTRSRGSEGRVTGTARAVKTLHVHLTNTALNVGD